MKKKLENMEEEVSGSTIRPSLTVVASPATVGPPSCKVADPKKGSISSAFGNTLQSIFMVKDTLSVVHVVPPSKGT